MSLAPYLMMADGQEQLLKAFRFQVNGTSDPDFQFPAGAVLDVVRTSIGLFTITLPVKWPSLVTLQGSVQAAGAAGDTLAEEVHLVSYTAATGVLIVRTENNLGVADDPADNDWVHLNVVFCRRTVLSAVGAV